jgi:protein-S-isoprenylcysteine O-methyltransferase Ste14
VTEATLRRIGHVLVAAQMSLIVLCVLPLGPVVALPDPVPAIGTVLLLLAGAVGVAALLSMGRRTRVHPVPGPDAVLHTRGIYAFVRHPMYLAVGLACAGAVASSGRVLGMVALPLLYVVLTVKARFEDRLLARAFGWQFAVYASRVPAVIPQPWRSHRH